MPRLLHLGQLWERWGVPGGNFYALPAAQFYGVQWVLRTRDVLIAERRAAATKAGYERLSEDTRLFLKWLKEITANG